MCLFIFKCFYVNVWRIEKPVIVKSLGSSSYEKSCMRMGCPTFVKLPLLGLPSPSYINKTEKCSFGYRALTALLFCCTNVLISSRVKCLFARLPN